MTRLTTSAEYLPLLPPPAASATQAFAKFQTFEGVSFTPKQVDCLAISGYELIDGMVRFPSRPSARAVDERLKSLTNALKVSSAPDVGKFCKHIHDLLERDDVGDAIGSLLYPAWSSAPHIRTLSLEGLERKCAALLSAVRELRSRLRLAYGGRRGPEPSLYLDELVLRLAKVWREAQPPRPARKRRHDSGLVPTAYYDHSKGDRYRPFVMFVEEVAHTAVECFAPFPPDAVQTAVQRNLRKMIKSSALEERVHIALSPNARERRRARSARSAVRRKARGLSANSDGRRRR